jgi:hypothetical protein
MGQQYGARSLPVVEVGPVEPIVTSLSADECRDHLFTAIDMLSDEAVIRWWRLLEDWMQLMAPLVVLLVGGHPCMTLML